MGFITENFIYQDHIEILYNLRKEIVKNPTRNRLEYFYKNNSFGTPNTCLLFKDDGEKDLVGASSVFPRAIIVRGLEYKIGVNCDMFVHKNYRTLGPALIILKKLINDCINLDYNAILAMPNTKSEAVVKRAGYKKIGCAFRWSLILKSETKISKFISTKWIRILLAFFFDNRMKFKFNNFFYYILNFRYWKKVNVIELSINDIKLSDTLDKNNNINELIQSDEFIQWRYIHMNDSKTNLFSIFENNKCLTYLIYSLNELKKEVVIHDIYNSNKDIFFFIIISKFIKKICQSHYETISILHFGNKNFYKILIRLGFIRRDSRNVYAIFCNDKLSYNDENSLLSELNWFDGDLDL